MNIRTVRFRLALVCALTTSLFPMSFAIAQGEEQAEQLATSLMTELIGMDIGRVQVHRADLDVTVTRPDGSRFKFSNALRHPGGASATAAHYDSDGRLADEFIIHSTTNVTDQNRIDFAVSRNGALSSGAITGLGNGDAIASINQDGFSSLFRVDYSGVDVGRPASVESDLSRFDQAADQLITASAMDGSRSPMGAAIIIGVVVIFVVATCLAFGWWGC